ncbi:hypothetical protein NEOLEDRAFT_1140679 [Neolentinus lepideus HHB14362 ss-1]|uniref:Uncharacterized protein n=1 Tax=Neolentinus lepideus HHB14362 ss-1 TaxID=1314782 RepID=A0A165P293_9AGAM|nr:hypothetical protein NEOLEDRAFT_1140679 [Neolentinus lepideus HHB14362 ss-1]
MAGANYMGGKRNAARARLKDHASRVQKCYFGKQRLDSALAKGLGIGSKSQREAIGGPGDIELAHARKAFASIMPSYDSSGTVEYSYIESPSTPVRHGRPESTSDSSVLSKKTHTSKVLNALDISERIDRPPLSCYIP